MDFLKAKEIFNQLYQNIDGYAISFGGKNKLKYFDRSLTYGEINFDSFYQILKTVNPQKEEIFYDLGSGTGKPVFAAHLLFNFKKSLGIEIVPDLYDASLEVKKNYEEKIKPFLAIKEKEGEIEFIKGDILEVDFSDGDIFFVNSTCFFQSLMIGLEKKFLNLKKGTKIITLTNRLNSEIFYLADSKIYKQSWGDATVNFYVKKI